MTLARALGILAAFLSWGGIANAQSARTALAIQLFDDAQKLMASDHAVEACPKYAESQNLDPQLGTLLHLADCYERVGKTASAWSRFKDAAELAAMRRDPRERAARAEIAKLESKLSKLVIVVGASAPAELVIRQDGTPVPRAAWSSPLPVDPGTHEIRAEAPGFVAWRSTVEIHTSASTVRVVVPELVPTAAESAPRDAAPSAPSSAVSASLVASPRDPTSHSAAPALSRAPRSGSESSSGTTRTALEFVSGGIGLAGVATGIVFAVRRSSKLSDREAVCGRDFVCKVDDPGAPARIEQLTREARSASTLSTVGFAVGSVGILGAVTLLVTAPPTGERNSHAIRLGGLIGTDATGVAVGGTW